MGEHCCRVLLSCCLSAAETGSGFTLEEFRNVPGIYFEHVGTLSLYTDVWTLAVRMDLSNLMGLEQSIEWHLEGYRDLCKASVSPDSHCAEMLKHLERLSAKVAEEIGVVHDLVGGEHPRGKRGLVDGLGSVLKAITGNLDASDGERIDKELSAVRETQETMRSGMQRQLQVVESSLDIFNRSSHASERNFEKLHAMLREVNGYFHNSTVRLATQQQFDESLGLMDAYMEMFLGEVRDIARLFAGITAGTVDPAILTPERLTRYLSEALPFVPKGHSFPRPVARENAAEILQLATTRAYRTGGNVTLLIEIPLVGAAEYSVSRTYPLPKRGENSTYYYVETSSELVVVDRASRNYIRMSERELEECKEDGTRFYCNPRHPALAVNEVAPCSVRTYVEGAVGREQHCAKRAVRLTRALIISLRQPGRWLYVAPQPEPVTVACDDMPTQQAIMHGTGSLTLTGRCTVTAADFRVEAMRRHTQQVVDLDLVPTYNLTLTPLEAECVPRVIDLHENITLEHVVSSPRELSGLGVRLQQLKEELGGIPTRGRQVTEIISQHILGAISLLAVVILVAFLLVRRCQRSQPSVEAPCTKGAKRCNDETPTEWRTQRRTTPLNEVSIIRVATETRRPDSPRDTISERERETQTQRMSRKKSFIKNRGQIQAEMAANVYPQPRTNSHTSSSESLSPAGRM